MNILAAIPPRAPAKEDRLATPEATRAVHLAGAALRCGAAVWIDDDGASVVALAAETADDAALALLDGSVLILSGHRGAALLGRVATQDGAPAAYELTGRLTAAVARGLADPTLAQLPPEAARALLRPVALPPCGAAAVRLAKIARLLPAMLLVQDGIAPAVAVNAAAIEGYPLELASRLHRVAEASVPLDSAPDARVIAFRPADGGGEHLAIVVGRPETDEAPLVRVHSACLTGDLLGSLRCDCGPQLRSALARMHAEGAGVLLYLAQEGRGIGLVNKLRAYAIQDRGEDTVDANLSLGWEVDERNFLPAAIMLEQLGLRRVRLLTNNPAKLAALSAHGIEVAGREPHAMPPNGVNDAYLATKARRLGHLLE